MNQVLLYTTTISNNLLDNLIFDPNDLKFVSNQYVPTLQLGHNGE